MPDDVNDFRPPAHRELPLLISPRLFERLKQLLAQASTLGAK